MNLFQQDGATPHNTNSIIQCLEQKFGDCFIMQCVVFSWPLRSPDLTLCDFFLWGRLKANMFSTPVPDLLMLKSRKQAEIGKVWKEMLQKDNENALACFHICNGNDGHHLPNVILK